MITSSVIVRNLYKWTFLAFSRIAKCRRDSKSCNNCFQRWICFFAIAMSTMTFILESHSQEMNHGDEEFEVGFVHRVIGAAVLAVISIVGIVGNLLVIVAVAASRKLQTITNVFVISLSVTDLLACALLPFQCMALVYPGNAWPLAYTFCQVVGGSIYLFTLTSVFTLANIAFNRFFFITRSSESYQWLYRSWRLYGFLASAWFLAALCLAVPELIGVETLGYSVEQHWCSWLSKPQDPIGIYETIAFVTTFFAFVLILFCYAKIFVRVRNQRRIITVRQQDDPTPSPDTRSCGAPSRLTTTFHAEQEEHDATPNSVYHLQVPVGLPGMPSSEQGGSSNPQLQQQQQQQQSECSRRRDSQINRNLFTVVCAFFLCVMPHSLCVLIPNHEIPSIYTFILMSVNCCINPIIYANRHPHFKLVFRCLIYCRYKDIPNPASWLRMLLTK